MEDARVELRDKVIRDLRAEIETLKAENANLRAAVEGNTFFHADEKVNEELGRLRDVVEKVREYAAELVVSSSISALKMCGNDFLSLLPEGS